MHMASNPYFMEFSIEGSIDGSDRESQIEIAMERNMTETA